MKIRNLTYLNNNRIIYRKYSSDKPTSTYSWGWYYKEGTLDYYSLFNSKAKINSYKSLKWHLLILWYLNPKITMDEFKELTEFISDKQNNIITFGVPEQILNNMMYEVYMEDLEEPPKNRLRKIVFKDGTGLSTKEKLSIVGGIAGKSKNIEEDDIYEAMLYLHEQGKITMAKLAKALKCSTRTIHRNMGEELKKEKELLNKQL
tara:strand:+ start:316 stop:927 length:612 start_codon:yes stop_codon:yes gene_type:complete